MTDTAAHECPGPGQHYPRPEVDPDKLACLRHWRQVPGPVQAAVYRTWDHGLGAGSAAHRAAMLAAIRAMRE
jgi:hypothetical protein